MSGRVSKRNKRQVRREFRKNVQLAFNAYLGVIQMQPWRVRAITCFKLLFKLYK